VPARAATERSRVVFCVVGRSSCRSIMLRQEELAYIKAISTLQLSPAVLRELRTALSRRKKKPEVPAGSRSTAPGGGSGTPQLPKGQLAGKRKTNMLARSGDSSESSIRRPAPSEGTALCPQVHRQSRAKKLLRAGGKSVRPRLGRRTRLS
jgi:hypothetical protein